MIGIVIGASKGTGAGTNTCTCIDLGFLLM